MRHKTIVIDIVISVADFAHNAKQRRRDTDGSRGSPAQRFSNTGLFSPDLTRAEQAHVRFIIRKDEI